VAVWADYVPQGACNSVLKPSSTASAPCMGMPSALRTALRAPSAPTTYLACTVRTACVRTSRESSAQRTNGTTHWMQGTGGLRLTGRRPLVLSQSTTSLTQTGSDWCTMNRWAVLGSNTCRTSQPQCCL
jgi:hypothetical protein